MGNVAKAVERLVESDLGRRAHMMGVDSLYWLSRRIDPRLNVGTFYAKLATWLLRAGLAHETLGPRLQKEPDGQVVDRNAVKGRRRFERLLALGLTPDDVVVDFGCGTLRIGRYLIDYLKPGNYWGFDVNNEILDHARVTVAECGLEAKHPNIVMATRENLLACAAAGPRVIISIAVLIHLPPAEIEEFCRCIAMIANRNTVFFGNFSATTPSARTWGTWWSYAPDEVRTVFQRFLPDHHVSTEVVTAKGRYRRATIYSASVMASPRQA
jgi:hypothetical protein